MLNTVPSFVSILVGTEFQSERKVFRGTIALAFVPPGASKQLLDAW